MKAALMNMIMTLQLIVRILITNVECASLSKYPPLHESKAYSSKVMDKWIQCDMCTEWFHLICLHENVDPEDDLVCENCC